MRFFSGDIEIDQHIPAENSVEGPQGFPGRLPKFGNPRTPGPAGAYKWFRKKHLMIRIAFVITAAITLAGCDLENIGPGDRFKSDFHYSYDVSSGARIDIESFNGSVEIEGWDQNKVDVEGTKFGATEPLRDAIRINISPSPGAVSIRAERPPDLHGSMGARFRIRAPRDAEIGRAVTSNGALRVSQLAGDAHLKTSNGSIRAQNLKGGVDAQTSNGPIDVADIRGDAVLHTSNGRVSGDDIGGNVEAQTSNGGINIRLDHSPSAPVKLETSNGPVELSMQERPRADIRARTNNGGISLHLPEDTSARIEATTSNNSISSDFDVFTHGQISKHRLDGSIGNGGPILTLSTSNGPIHILKGGR